LTESARSRTSCNARKTRREADEPQPQAIRKGARHCAYASRHAKSLFAGGQAYIADAAMNEERHGKQPLNEAAVAIKDLGGRKAKYVQG
jgi:hypothetical protein